MNETGKEKPTITIDTGSKKSVTVLQDEEQQPVAEAPAIISVAAVCCRS